MRRFIQITFFISVFSVFAGCGCVYKTLICPATNNPVLYPRSQKCAKKFYEDAVKTYTPTLDATVNVIDQVTISAKAGVKAEAQLLKDKLSSEDQLMQKVLESATLTLQQRPCDGDAIYKKALDDVAQYKIRLETIKSDLNKSKTETEIKETIDKYTEGKNDGRNVGVILGSLDRYYADNNSYPSDLSKLTGKNAIEAIKALGLSIIYTVESNDIFTLRFAGEDGKLNTSDDKLHKSIKGKPVSE